MYHDFYYDVEDGLFVRLPKSGVTSERLSHEEMVALVNDLLDKQKEHEEAITKLEHDLDVANEEIEELQQQIYELGGEL